MVDLTQDQNNQQKRKRVQPQSQMDWQLMITDPMTGTPDANPELITKLNKTYTAVKPDGKVVQIPISNWSNLAIFTRDIRLGNIGKFDGEMEYFREHISFSHELLKEGYKDAFEITYGRALVISESSQSRGGFLRKLINTIRQETFNTEKEPPKKKIFGFKGKEEY